MVPESESRYTGPSRFVEYPEAAGKTVAQLRFWHSPAEAQAITIQFTDGTRVHIGIEALLKVKTEVGQFENHNLKVKKTYRTIIGAPVL